jgi:hypothetical protein
VGVRGRHADHLPCRVLLEGVGAVLRYVIASCAPTPSSDVCCLPCPACYVLCCVLCAMCCVLSAVLCAGVSFDLTHCLDTPIAVCCCMLC